MINVKGKRIIVRTGGVPGTMGLPKDRTRRKSVYRIRRLANGPFLPTFG